MTKQQTEQLPYRTDARSELEIRAQELILLAKSGRQNYKTASFLAEEILLDTSYQEILHVDLLYANQRSVCYKYFQDQDNLVLLTRQLIGFKGHHRQIKKELHSVEHSRKGGFYTQLDFLPNVPQLITKAKELAKDPIRFLFQMFSELEPYGREIHDLREQTHSTRYPGVRFPEDLIKAVQYAERR